MRVNNNIIWNTLALWFLMQISTQTESLFFRRRYFFPCWLLKLSLMLNSAFDLDNELCIHDSWLIFIYFVFLVSFIFIFLIFSTKWKTSFLKKILSIIATYNDKT